MTRIIKCNISIYEGGEEKYYQRSVVKGAYSRGIHLLIDKDLIYGLYRYDFSDCSEIQSYIKEFEDSKYYEELNEQPPSGYAFKYILNACLLEVRDGIKRRLGKKKDKLNKDEKIEAKEKKTYKKSFKENESEHQNKIGQYEKALQDLITIISKSKNLKM